MGCWWLCWWECSALLEIGTGGFCCLLVSVELQRKIHTSQFTNTKHIILISYVTFTRWNTNICSPFNPNNPFLSCLRTFLSSSLAPVLDRWDLPVSVFPFNTVILLYLACTGTSNPYFPNYPAHPPGAPESTNYTQLHVPQVSGWNRITATNNDTKRQPKWFAIHALKNIHPVILLIRFYYICPLSFPCHIVLAHSAIALSFICYLPVLPL